MYKPSSEKPFTAKIGALLTSVATLWTVTFALTILARSFGLLARYGFGDPGDSLFTRVYQRVYYDACDSFEFAWKILIFLALPILFIPDTARWLRLFVWTIVPFVVTHFLIGGYVLDGNYSLLFMAPVGLFSGILHQPLHSVLERWVSVLRSTLIWEG